MSALGQKRTLRLQLVMSALPPKADIAERDWHVRFGPEADSCTATFVHGCALSVVSFYGPVQSNGMCLLEFVVH
jgi:hypothetical protein